MLLVEVRSSFPLPIITSTMFLFQFHRLRHHYREFRCFRSSKHTGSEITDLNSTFTKPNGAKIDYYEIHIKPLTQQVYPELPATHLVGYDGISPGPTFHMTFGTEAVVRFINEGNDKPTVTHLHGSISKTLLDRKQE